MMISLVESVPAEPEVLRAGDIMLAPRSATVTKNSEVLRLFPMEFKLLKFLMMHPNQLFTADTLIAMVWSSKPGISNGTVRTHVKMLRQKIDSPGRSSLIKTVQGRGYRIEAP